MAQNNGGRPIPKIFVTNSDSDYSLPTETEEDQEIIRSLMAAHPTNIERNVEDMIPSTERESVMISPNRSTRRENRDRDIMTSTMTQSTIMLLNPPNRSTGHEDSARDVMTESTAILLSPKRSMPREGSTKENVMPGTTNGSPKRQKKTGQSEDDLAADKEVSNIMRSVESKFKTIDHSSPTKAGASSKDKKPYQMSPRPVSRLLAKDLLKFPLTKEGLELAGITGLSEMWYTTGPPPSANQSSNGFSDDEDDLAPKFWKVEDQDDDLFLDSLNFAENSNKPTEQKDADNQPSDSKDDSKGDSKGNSKGDSKTKKK